MGILRLLPQPSARIVDGSVLYRSGAAEGNDASLDLAKIPLADLQKIRGSEIACIFQEPMQALNPVVTIKKQLLEVFRYTQHPSNCHPQHPSNCHPQHSSSCHPRLDRGSPSDNLAAIREMLALAGFKDIDRVLDAYPHELSGGMLQRVCIVMALLPKPRLSLPMNRRPPLT
jgi:ABC-type dipeptide/oligopeptide/nickel transport system, ATPase component